MGAVRVLIADDSVVYRSQIRAALSRLPWIEVVGVCANGKIAVERMTQVGVDLLILDLEMPEMDGIGTLRDLKNRNIDCKVLVFSSLSKRGAEITFEALRVGANDFVTKPSASLGLDGEPSEKILALLKPKLEALFPVQPESTSGEAQSKGSGSSFSKVNWSLFSPKLLVIGSSTGGPTALERIFTEMPGPYTCPIVIVQHMPPIFTATFAARLGKLANVPAKEIQQGDVLSENTIYVAPGDFHVRMMGKKEKVILGIDQGPLIHSVRPAVDPLFETAAAIYRESLLGLILTGMGSDGKKGAIAIKESSGAMVIQDKESSVVFGMPGSVFEAGAYDKMVPLQDLPQVIGEKVRAR